MKIDATQNTNNECDLYIAPEIWCNVDDSFWATVFLGVEVGIAAICSLSIIYNLWNIYRLTNHG